MWLIDTERLRLKEFLSDVPAYAVLSHTWAADADEVTFQEFRKRKKVTRAKLGYKKIQKAAEQVVKDGCKWLWVDTCCIDKRSSAELSEAINSMYRYYERSEVCYALLSDVPNGDAIASPSSAFRNSRWFTRGWTLQELIAPWEVDFFYSDWVRIGKRRLMASLISEITGIDREVLTGRPLAELSIAKKMSWASRRTTKRPEDVAYSLLGLFDISMAPLYGEGSKAFLRLQEAIIKQADDHSIFAGTEDCAKPRAIEALAPSPHHFLGAGNIIAETFDHEDESEDGSEESETGEHEALPFSVTNAGVEITLPLRCVDKDDGKYEAALECTMAGKACDCSYKPGTDKDHELHCSCLLANNRVILEVTKIKGAVRAFRRQSLRYGPVNDEFELRLIHLW